MTKKQESVKVHYDSTGNTLNVWFGDPKKEFISEEAGNDVILNKNRKGNVIGFEKLNFMSGDVGSSYVLPVEVVSR